MPLPTATFERDANEEAPCSWKRRGLPRVAVRLAASAMALNASLGNPTRLPANRAAGAAW